eukprot:CAMPEP_0194529746 /NCGR_PEP_ID=MMETSP0253-20130528/66530_1 /TAXON_ID=2966 /ORGANISM="Noctiluca scintillans" /LENGTH=185 /DNA_ID=CAMNT_0039374905 /DNA_START=32 /DNA_END=589 /DNA_ORIENTATION=-
MGIFKRLFHGLPAKKKVRIIVVGLDNSGKSTVLNCLKPKKASLETVPTVGFATEEFQKYGVTFSFFDMSGQSRYRNLWEHYYNDVDGIIVVVDSSDKLRFAVAKDEVETMLEDTEKTAKKAPILFLANKMDVPSAATVTEVSTAMDLDLITDRMWNIVAADALKGDGLEDGLRWLVEEIKRSDAS